MGTPSDPSMIPLRIPAKIHTHKALVFAVGLVSSAFGAGVTWLRAVDAARVEISDMIAPVSLDAKAARAEAMACQEAIRAMRPDLARGFGRALFPNVPGRDAAGKQALMMYQREVGHGTSPEEAMRQVLEADF